MAGTDALAGPPLSNGGMMATASQQPAPNPEVNTDTRISGDDAGYMELQGAVKDGDCEKVNVEGGVSQDLGCCNEFQPESAATKKFDCGDCQFVKAKEQAELETGAPIRALAEGMKLPRGFMGRGNPPGLGAEE